jgi:Trypsin-co-occurring domain 1
MVDEGPTEAVGVELFVLDDVAVSPRSPGGEGADDPDYAPAAGHRRGSGWRQKVVAFGHDNTQTAGRVVGEQIATVLREALVGMDGAGLPTSGAGLVTSSVQVSFGLKLTEGVGKAIEAVMSAGGEASVQVTVTLTRPTPSS